MEKNLGHIFRLCNWRLAIGDWLLVIGYWRLAIGNWALHRYYACDMRMWVVINQREVLKLKVEEIRYLRIDKHLW